MSAELLSTPEGVASARAALEDLDRRLARAMSSPVVMPGERPRLVPPRLQDLIGPHRTPVVDLKERREREELVQALMGAAAETKPDGGEVYSFNSIFPPGHFVGDYVAYWAHCTDAPREYHEVAALVLLAMATSDIRIDFPFQPNLRTNLYALLIGETTRSKKSSVKDIASDIARRSWSTPAMDILLPDRATPEGLARKLSEKSGRPSLWAVDEIGPELAEMHSREHMKAKEELLLQLYGQSDYEYSRSKDSVPITGSHLNILACAADAIFDGLSMDQVRSGLLPRFVVVPLTVFPPPLNAFEAAARSDSGRRDGLVDRLKRLSRASWLDGKQHKPRVPHFTSGAKDAYSEFEHRFAETLKKEPPNKEMFARLKMMGVKVAVLAAVGTMNESSDDEVLVDEVAMERGLLVIDRWMGFARTFTSRLGENAFERNVSRVLSWMRGRGGKVRKSAVAQGLHLQAYELRNLEETLKSRGLIEIEAGEKPKRGPAPVWWVLVPDQESET